MRIIAKSALVKFWSGLPAGKHANHAEKALSEWYSTVSDASWNNFADVKATFNTADYVGNGKVVFDVGGNKYRIVALLGFRTQRLFILFAGSHADYDDLKLSEL